MSRFQVARGRNESGLCFSGDVDGGSRAFANRCANCHGNSGNGDSNIGQNLYPKTPDLRSSATQNLTDGEIHYIIKNGARLTGMPAWGNPHIEQDDTDAWKLILFLLSIAG
jgi:mono/diheme cytochrome c family protein